MTGTWVKRTTTTTTTIIIIVVVVVVAVVSAQAPISVFVCIRFDDLFCGVFWTSNRNYTLHMTPPPHFFSFYLAFLFCCCCRCCYCCGWPTINQPTKMETSQPNSITLLVLFCFVVFLFLFFILLIGNEPKWSHCSIAQLLRPNWI